MKKGNLAGLSLKLVFAKDCRVAGTQYHAGDDIYIDVLEDTGEFIAIQFVTGTVARGVPKKVFK